MRETGRLYASIINERLSEDPHVRHAMCASEIETALLDRWCLVEVRAPRGSLDAKMQSLLRVVNENRAAQSLSSPASQRLLRQLVDYMAARRKYLSALKEVKNGPQPGDGAVYRFDSEFTSFLPKLTDPLLYSLAGVSAEDPDLEWEQAHGSMSVELCARFGQRQLEDLIRRMQRETYIVEQQERRAAQREQMMRQQFGMPGLGRRLR